MKRWFSSLLLFCLAVSLARAAEQAVFSGPQPGERLTPFRVLIATGPRKGQEADLIQEFGGAPTVLVFVHELTRPGAALMRPLDTFQQRRAADGLKLAFVFLTQDRGQSERHLPLVAGSLRTAAPLAISLDGPEGPGNYGLNRTVQITVVVAKENRVTASFALVQPNETDAPKVLAEVVRLIGGTVPPLEELGVPARGMRPAMEAGRPGAHPAGALPSPTTGPGRDGPGRRAAEAAVASPALPSDAAALRRDLEALRAQTEALQRRLEEMRRQLSELEARLAQPFGRVQPPAGAAPAPRTPTRPEGRR